MSRHPRAGSVAIVTVLLLAVVIAGCGRGRLAAGDGAAAPHETLAATLDDRRVVEPTPTAGTITTPTPPGPAPTTAPTPAPTAGPLVAPDLTSIQQLLDDLDAALGADATADTDEGSPK